MKTVLCYGDSITWGYEPLTMERYDIHTRWTGVMRDMLGEDFHVIEEGLCGRLTVWEHDFLPGRNGLAVLPPILASHAPLDLVILMLGTNDIQPDFDHAPNEVARGAGRLIDVIRQSLTGPGGTSPRCLLVAPPPLVNVQGFMRIGFDGAESKSRELAGWYIEVAKALDCDFLDAGDFCEGSSGDAGDGVHPDAVGHRALGVAMGTKVRELLD